MGTFLLVHGAAHGAWCWYKVLARLQEAGHKALAFDLPGHGIDRTPPEHVTLLAYVQRVCQELEKQEQPVILVGHSMAGAVISQVAEVLPHKIHTLVYLASCVLPSGQSLMQAAEADGQSQLKEGCVIDTNSQLCHLLPNCLGELFYQDCEAADVTLAQALLTPQPLAPLLTPVRLSERFERVRRASIETALDRVVSIDFQRYARANKLCDQVYTLASGHSPFFSMPDALVQCLVAVERQPSSRL
ncbi:MAG: alpha/beta fold hydrolase [Ktedonobacteraceae bacterium]